jgi:hypothetical protein
MLGRIASVGSKAVKVGACAALIAAGAAGVSFYEGGRERVAHTFGPYVEKAQVIRSKTEARAEGAWDKVEADPEKYLGILIAVVTFATTLLAIRTRRKSVEPLVAALIPQATVSPAVRAIQNKELLAKCRAELKSMDARAAHFDADLARAERQVANKRKDVELATDLLGAAEKEFADASDALAEYRAEKDAHLTNRAELVAEIARLEDAV